MSIRLRRRIPSPPVAILAAIVCASLAMPVTAAPPVFSAGTVAKRYNFRLDGSGTDGNVVAMVGWFEATEADAPNVVAGQIHLSSMHAVNSFVLNLPLQTSSSSIEIADPTNGVYTIFLRYAMDSVDMRISGFVMLDDPRGRAGKLAGPYIFRAAVTNPGVLSGEIAAQ